MPRWSSQKIWIKLSKLLSCKVGRDFERAVLPCLRILWPTIQQAPPLGAWDRKGIDLLTWTEIGSFECVVQCKGFEVRDLGNDQIRQAKKSIKAFRESRVKAKIYILLHNRDGRNEDFRNAITRELNALVREGFVENAYLWHRQEMLDHAFDGMKTRLNSSLRLSAREILQRTEHLFTFKLPYLSMVPLTEGKLIFKRYKPCQHAVIKENSIRDVKKILLTPSESRWTLFVGIFGAGKTTAALHAALSTNTIPIFIQAATLSPESLGSGTNLLLKEVVKSLNLLDEFDDEDLSVLESMAGSVLGYLLRYPSSKYLFILDALDENRMYSKLDGLQRLNNQLAEFTCPVILTTRKEHLNEMFGNFSLAFHEMSSKYGPDRSARLLELEAWEQENVVEVVEEILPTMFEKEKKHLETFHSLLQSGQYIDFYGDLPHSPLFLQFLLDDILENGIRKTNRTGLLRSWVEKKIRRDRTVTNRVSLSPCMDTEEFVAKMLLLLEKIAQEMVIESPAGVELLETIDSKRVCTLAKKFFPAVAESILPLLLHSVLIPQGFRRGTQLRLLFAFRVFQEFFLASSLMRQEKPCGHYPGNITDFVTEIKQENGKIIQS